MNIYSAVWGLAKSVQESGKAFAALKAEGADKQRAQQSRFLAAIVKDPGGKALKLFGEGKGAIDPLEEGGDSALSLAIEHGREALALEMIAGEERRERLGAKNLSGDTPLWQAVRKNMKDLAGALLEKGVDMRVKNGNGCSLLCWALKNGREEMGLLMVEQSRQVELGASFQESSGKDSRGIREASCLNDTDAQGNTATMAVFMQGRYDLAEKLVEAGAKTDVDGKEWRSWIPVASTSARWNQAGAMAFLEKARQIESSSSTCNKKAEKLVEARGTRLGKAAKPLEKQEKAAEPGRLNISAKAADARRQIVAAATEPSQGAPRKTARASMG